MPHIDAVEYTLKDRATNIFAVPERDAVGTNSYHNAITILDLSGRKVKYREVRRGFKTHVSGGTMVFLPEFSRDTIGYSQTRRLLGLRTRWASEKQFKDDSWEWSAPGGSLAWDATGDAMRMGVLRRETMPSDKSRFVLRIDTTEVENALAAMSEVTTASVTVGGTGKLIVDPCLSGRRFEQSIRLFATTITR